jgi:cytochrome c556
MSMRAQVLGLGIATLALATLLLIAAGSGSAADDEKEAKEIQAAVRKLADAVEQNNAAEVKKQAAALQKYDLLPVMKQLKLRANGGMGIGEKPGTVTPDGIEAKLIGMARKGLAPAELGKQGADIARAAYIMAAIGEVAKDKSPVKKKMGEKDPKDWAKWSEDMAKFGKELGDATKAKDAAKVKTAAANLNSSCNSCHGIFRD